MPCPYAIKSLRDHLPWKAVAVFTGNDECLNHLRLFEVAPKLVELVEPEGEASRISIAPEVAKVFHHHKRAPVRLTQLPAVLVVVGVGAAAVNNVMALTTRLTP